MPYMVVYTYTMASFNSHNMETASMSLGLNPMEVKFFPVVIWPPLYHLRSTGFIRVREMSGKFKIFQGQGIVRELHNLSGKIEFLLKCQGNVREF